MTTSALSSASLSGWSPRERPGQSVLPGRHVGLEPFSSSHVGALYAATCSNDQAESWRYRTVAMPASLEEFAEAVGMPLLNPAPGAAYAVVDPDAGPVGFFACFPCSPTNGVVELSGVLWGQRLQRTPGSTEAVHLVLRHLFDDLGYRRVEWKCDSRNEASRQAALRLGFTFEGTFRQHMVVKGESRDTEWFAMLDGEWPEIRERHERWLAPENFDEAGRQRRRLADC